MARRWFALSAQNYSSVFSVVYFFSPRRARRWSALSAQNYSSVFSEVYFFHHRGHGGTQRWFGLDAQKYFSVYSVVYFFHHGGHRAGLPWMPRNIPLCSLWFNFLPQRAVRNTELVCIKCPKLFLCVLCGLFFSPRRGTEMVCLKCPELFLCVLYGLFFHLGGHGDGLP